MVTQELVDYIRAEIDAGMHKQDVAKVLVANDWSVQDVQSAFALIEHRAAKKKPTKVRPGIYIFTALMLLVVAAGAAYYYVTNIDGAKNAPVQQPAAARTLQNRLYTIGDFSITYPVGWIEEPQNEGSHFTMGFQKADDSRVTAFVSSGTSTSITNLVSNFEASFPTTFQDWRLIKNAPGQVEVPNSAPVPAEIITASYTSTTGRTAVQEILLVLYKGTYYMVSAYFSQAQVQTLQPIISTFFGSVRLAS